MTPRNDLSNLTWRKSSYSNANGGDCLEVAADIPGVLPVRDSKDPSAGTLLIGFAAWSSFVSTVVAA